MNTKIKITRFVLALLLTLNALGISTSAALAASFSVDPAAPDPFGKLTPANGTIDLPTSSLTLRWEASSANATYQYCLRTNKASCPPPKWIRVGTNTSVTLQGLNANTRYYWQVRAVDPLGQITEADGKQWWQFTTVQNPLIPGPFNKLTPVDAPPDFQPLNGLSLTWSASSLATSYQYCYDTQNNNLCDTSWRNASGLSASLDGLSYGTTYYWQVRAVNASGSVQADFGTWFSFQTLPAPGGAFGKTVPANLAVEQPVNLVLIWGISAGTGITYEYCIGTTPCTDSSTWNPAGTNLSASVSGLQYATTYYWQVRAVNPTAAIYADDGAGWSFTTQVAPPANFSKISPVNNASSRPLSLALSWAASAGAAHYEYCLSLTACSVSSTWSPVGTNTSVAVSGLSYATTYYWQVRAVNSTGVTAANNGTVWQFTTQVAPPQGFVKLSPVTASSDRMPNLILEWSPSAGASDYFYCVDTTSHPQNDTTCNTGWVENSTTASNPLSLAYNQTYYWQVRAENDQGVLQADNGVWWSFATIAAPPSDFTKTVPFDGEVDQPLQPWLYWWSPPGSGTGFEYCINTGANCPGNNWTSISENTPIQVSAPPLAHNTIYYWQVRAYRGGVWVYANDAWWSFTTLKAPPSSSNQAFSTNEGASLTGTLSATSNYQQNFALYGSLPAGTLEFHSDGSFTYTPVAYFNGTVTFQFILSDGYNAPVGPYTVTITVNPVNNPPQLGAMPDQVALRGARVVFQAQAADPDLPYGDILTYSIDEILPPGATMDPVTGLFQWVVPGTQPFGTLTFTVRVTDTGGLSASQQVQITIEPLRLFLPFTIRS